MSAFRWLLCAACCGWLVASAQETATISDDQTSSDMHAEENTRLKAALAQLKLTPTWKQHARSFMRDLTYQRGRCRSTNPGEAADGICASTTMMLQVQSGVENQNPEAVPSDSAVPATSVPATSSALPTPAPTPTPAPSPPFDPSTLSVPGGCKFDTRTRDEIAKHLKVGDHHLSIKKERNLRLYRHKDALEWDKNTPFQNSGQSEMMCLPQEEGVFANEPALSCAGIDLLLEGAPAVIETASANNIAVAQSAANSLGAIDMHYTKTLTPRECTDAEKANAGKKKCMAYSVTKKCTLYHPDKSEKGKIVDMTNTGIKDECSIL